MAAPDATPWTRETRWRQGSVLPLAAVEQLQLHHPTDAAATCVVVISHDCDLANDNLTVEPHVELIVGRLVDQASGNYTWGKAPRTLHYTVTRSADPVHIELISTRKRVIAKSELACFAPDDAFILDGRTLAVLRSWLGSRYNRAAFPDAFVNRMGATKADTKLAKVLEKYGELISFVYFDVDTGRHVERADGDPYELSIVLVFDPGEDAEDSSVTADRVAEAVESAVGGRLQDGKAVVLKSCFAISEDDLPISRAKVLTQWRLEYMTLRAEDDQPRPPEL